MPHLGTSCVLCSSKHVRTQSDDHSEKSFNASGPAIGRFPHEFLPEQVMTHAFVVADGAACRKIDIPKDVLATHHVEHLGVVHCWSDYERFSALWWGKRAKEQNIVTLRLSHTVYFGQAHHFESHRRW